MNVRGNEERIADFRDPPIVETVLSVQFEPLNLTNAHFGWFWKEFLGEEWVRTEDAPLLADQFERFGESAGLRVVPRLSVRSKAFPERVFFVNSGDDRVVQLQNSRLVYNWRKREGEYPHHEERLRHFRDVYERLEKFVEAASLGEIVENQWEVTYVNHVPRGEIWQTPRDWHEVLPALVSPWCGTGDVPLENTTSEWRHEIAPQLGRLHVKVSRRLTGPPQSDEVLALELTARGPVSGSAGMDLDSGFARGRQAIVECFVDMTSESVRKDHWGQL